jgi:dTDP-4-dehydrorhamnose reductase
VRDAPARSASSDNKYVVMTDFASQKSAIDSPRTLIIGRNGRLAKALRYVFPLAQAVGRNEIDIADRVSVTNAIEQTGPTIIVNCAAVTDLELCERDPVGTRRVNVEGVANLAAVSRTSGALLIHLSSDYAANPVNEYGKGKRESEPFGDLTIRAKIYDGSHWAWEALRNSRRIQMTTCEVSNPISTTGLAVLLPTLLKKNLRGVVSLGSAHPLSFFEIGRIWADVLGASRDLVEPTGAISTPYERPADSFMAVRALVECGISVPSLAADASEHRAYFMSYGIKA